MITFNRVLLIDEDTTNNLIFKKLTATVKFSKEIITCISGLDGLEFLENCIKTNDTLPDLIFLDIRMPIMNGWEFMEQYQKLIPKMNKSVPVVILSTSDNEQDLLKAKEFAQIIRYIVKPLSIQKLKDLQSHFAMR